MGGRSPTSKPRTLNRRAKIYRLASLSLPPTHGAPDLETSTWSVFVTARFFGSHQRGASARAEARSVEERDEKTVTQPRAAFVFW